MLQDKKILLGVCGSIAAFKAAVLLRVLVREGAQVQVVMTPAAAGFVTPLTLSTLSGRPVHATLAEGEQWHNHVHLGRWADLMLVAPASANTLAKMAHGLCDNLLTAVYLSAACPVMFAPAMDEDMWRHPATRANVERLVALGHVQLPVETGPLASGLQGEGRMAEPETIVARLQDWFAARQALAGKRALVTAGPTYEPIDPVRFIGNHSSGRMGIALAEALARRGAAVDLVLGPTALEPATPGITLTRVGTAADMHAACLRLFPNADIAVLAAAVADYRPRQAASEKIKKSAEEVLHLDLERTPDILRDLGERKRPEQLLAGFALETEKEEAHAQDKLRSKKADLIVLNSLRSEGAGFGYDTNQVTIFDKDGGRKAYPLKSKAAVADDIVNYIIEKL